MNEIILHIEKNGKDEYLDDYKDFNSIFNAVTNLLQQKFPGYSLEWADTDK